MAPSFGCKCEERQKPIAERNWLILKYRCHYSAFAGYHRTWSKYSTVICKTCGVSGRTKADYVDTLKALGKIG